MDELRVLVTTDNHLGYLEKDHIRGDDSFRAFEEVFEHAKRVEADCVLLCGDLFHEAHPSNHTIARTMKILQKYCIGNKPVQIECESNNCLQDLARNTNKQPNYHSKEMKISMPVFSIHGNHDEPSGYKGTSPMHIFAEANIVNYFGTVDSIAQKIEVKPIILRKGQAIMNLYGIGALRDERLAKIFAEERISFLRAKKGTNILVLHQTRCNTGARVYLSEDLLTPEMDLVVWGHMHQSLPAPQKNAKMGFYTVQPGSTVQTSLAQAESGDKHCILLKISPEGWKTETIAMQSTRRLIFRSISVPEKELEKKIIEEMRKILAECTEALKPLVRLRVEVEGHAEKSIIPRRTMEEFKHRVANPKEVLRLVHWKRKALCRNTDTDTTAAEKSSTKAHFSFSVEGVRILSADAFMDSIFTCIDRGDKSAITQRYNEITKSVVGVLKSHRWTDIEKEIDSAAHEVQEKILYLHRTRQSGALPRHSIDANTTLNLDSFSEEKRKTHIEIKDEVEIKDENENEIEIKDEVKYGIKNNIEDKIKSNIITENVKKSDSLVSNPTNLTTTPFFSLWDD